MWEESLTDIFIRIFVAGLTDIFIRIFVAGLTDIFIRIFVAGLTDIFSRIFVAVLLAKGNPVFLFRFLVFHCPFGEIQIAIPG